MGQGAVQAVYVFGRHFKILTEHKTLKWVAGIKDPISRLLKWLRKMDGHDFRYNITRVEFLT